MNLVKEKKRIEYIDILKTIAIFAIIFNHVCLITGNAEIFHIQILNFKHIGSVGVAIFLMISGVLLLNKNYDYFNSFLKKKLARITLPYLFWVMILILTVAYLIPERNIEFIKICFFDYFLNFGYSWYYWLMIGVYLAIPVINEFIKNKGLKGAEYFIKMFFIAVVFYSVCIFFNIQTYLYLLFFIGPLSFIILGYYLHNKKFNISPSILAILGIVGFLITFFIRVRTPNELYYIFLSINSIREVSCLDVSIFSVIEALCVFITIKAIFDSEAGIFSQIKKFLYLPILKKFFLSVSKSSYGMYLAHLFLINLFIDKYKHVLNLSGTKTLLIVILTTLIFFVISWILVLVVSRVPYLKKFSGYA